MSLAKNRRGCSDNDKHGLINEGGALDAQPSQKTASPFSFLQSDNQAESARWYWNRLRCMSAPEIGHRLRQRVSAQLQQFGLGTVLQVPDADLSMAGPVFVAMRPSVSIDTYMEAADQILAGRLRIFDSEYLLGEVPQWNRDPKTGRHAPMVFGKTLDYRDDALVGDIKYLWEPNRHLQLTTLAQAYRLTGERRYQDGLRRQLNSWFEQCPYLMGPNWTSSLELGIRLINWSLVWQLIGGAQSPLFVGDDGRGFQARWLTSIYQHMHFIVGHMSRYSSANNHLIGELAGLYIGAVTWPHWPDATRWRQRARADLIAEALQQNAEDGVNREQAISYQQFVFDFLLLAALAGRAAGDEFPETYWARLEKMLEFVASIMDAGGHVPQWGDADDGYVVMPAERTCPYRSQLAIGAVLFDRGDFKQKAKTLDDKGRWLLGDDGLGRFERLAPVNPATRLRRAYPEGGYYILGDAFETEKEVRIVVDVGPLGYQAIAAHGHSDALAFTLSLGGHEFLIDPGTYAYHTERAWRDYFRGTAAHNTVRVDGLNQSIIGGSFMWLRHAKSVCHEWESRAEEDYFVGSHDGYQRLADPVRHERGLLYHKRARRLEVTDFIQCRAPHSVERFWHFAEDVTVGLEPGGAIWAAKAGWQLRLIPDGAAVTANVYRGRYRPIAGWVSRRFGVKVPATTVAWTVNVETTTELQTIAEITGP